MDLMWPYLINVNYSQATSGMDILFQKGLPILPMKITDENVN